MLFRFAQPDTDGAFLDVEDETPDSLKRRFLVEETEMDGLLEDEEEKDAADGMDATFTPENVSFDVDSRNIARSITFFRGAGWDKAPCSGILNRCGLRVTLFVWKSTVGSKLVCRGFLARSGNDV